MAKSLAARLAYFIQYYQRMKWQILPEDLIEMCAEDCSDEWNDFGWRTCMSARTYIIQQRYGQ